MGEKDITEKILADYNDVFADIMNGLLFAGEQRRHWKIRPFIHSTKQKMKRYMSWSET